ncbi:MAG: LytTR family DNA-binding domain-containing protein [Oscillospiraceae bacterium]|nr:LytTR family DNA-binding domain-containing protein [Oscillospiraceae bacterium]
MRLTFAICDDDGEQTKGLRRMLADWSADKPFSLQITEYEDAEEFSFDYPENPCDLLLLDIEMKGINGMELAKKLRDRGDMLPIIFITGYSEYMSEGYDVEALHYLLKPISPQKLYGVLDKYIERYSSHSREILVTCGGRALHIPTDSIIYIEAFGRKIQLHLADKGTLDCGMNLGSFENVTGLIHCHRSYLVNLRFVRSIGKNTAVLDNGEELPVSRRLFSDVNRQFIDFYTGG